MKIILAVDGSQYSRWATDLVATLPLTKPPAITVVHVVDLVGLTQPVHLAPALALRYSRIMNDEVKKNFRAAERLTARIACRFRRRWRQVRPIVEEGNPAECIIRRAKRERTDLIVLGSHGRSDIASVLMGSVSHKVATYAPCSILVVRKKSRAIRHALVAVDGSRDSAYAVKFLATHVRPRGIRVSVLNVWDYPFAPPELPEATVEMKESNVLASAGITAIPLTVSGHPAAKIVEVARRKHVNLVVVGSRGFAGVKRFLLGSVSHKVLRFSPCPVLMVRRRSLR